MLVYIVKAPLWVWPLLGWLCYMGWKQSRLYRVMPNRLLIMPVLFLLLSIQAAGSLASQTAMLAWLGGVLAGVVLLGQCLPPVSRGLDEAGRLQVEGSWLPLTAMLTVFCLKYAMGAAAATHSTFWLQALPLLISSSVLGMVSGMFAMRAALLWRQARQWRLAMA